MGSQTWWDLEVPVTPDGDEAREWAREELARDIYQNADPAENALFSWLADLFEQLFTVGGTVPASAAPVVVVAVVAVLVVLGFLLSGPVRRRHRAPAGAGAGGAELFEDARSAADLSREADEAAGQGDWSRALLQRYRALIRSLDERVLLEDRPGLTAVEAARLAATAFPNHHGGLRAAAEDFNSVRYGDHDATRADYDRVHVLATDLAAARPHHAAVTTVAGASAVGGGR